MRSASSTIYKRISLLGCFFWLAAGLANAQTENSPYSRYGLGDQLPGNNIMSRGMGGIASAYADILTVNFVNPASYSRLKRATLDFGLDMNSRTLRVIDPPQKFSSISPNISYVQLGLPLSQKRNWGMNLGLRPVTRISYKLERNERLAGVDSISSLFEGNGGTYEVYTGTGFAIKNLSVGINVGYLFGSKDYNTKRLFIPDSVTSRYYPSEHSVQSNFGGVFANAGIQYSVRVNKKDMIRLGAHGSLKRSLNSNREEKIQTYQMNDAGRVDSIDVIHQSSTSGKVVYPATYGAGLIYHSGDKWLIGADISQTKWGDYRFHGQVDSVQDSWKLALGAQMVPNATGNVKSYWGRVTYRAGFTIGQDYVRVGNDLPVWSGSFGLGLPMRPPNYSNQYSIINTSIEFGQRGNSVNSIRESFFRLSLGLTLSDIWFIKRKYD